MKNAIIILNYNDNDNTIRLVDSIINYKSIQDIVVVDNCSTDESYEVLSDKYQSTEHIHILQTERNGGYAYGNNYGCKYAIKELGAEYLTIANPDIFFEDETLMATLECAENHEDAGCVAPYMICEKSSQSPMAWRLPTYWDCLIESTVVLGRWYRKRVVYSDDYLKGDYAVPVDVVAGSFFVIQATVLEECGWLDEETFLYYEENILAKKLQNTNRRSYIVSGCSYEHGSSESIDNAMGNFSEKLRIANESRYIYLKKYCGCNKIGLAINNIFFAVGILLFGLIKNNSK